MDPVSNISRDRELCTIGKAPRSSDSQPDLETTALVHQAKSLLFFQMLLPFHHNAWQTSSSLSHSSL